MDEHGDYGAVKALGEEKGPTHPFWVFQPVRANARDTSGGEKENASIVFQGFRNFTDRGNGDMVFLSAIGDKDAFEVIYVHKYVVDDDFDIIPDFMDDLEECQAVEPS